ncbi:MAG TPA: DUF3160 domain-containing protein [Ignavibacteriaceae bacterium]|nr:DUF3160 domain-containing protein [Ignavibacteriaceae bacterium]
MKKILLLLFFISPMVFSQTLFDINQYKSFLNTHQNLITENLLQMHNAGVFESSLNLNFNDALFFDSINFKYQLTPYEKSLIQQNGFLVTDRLKRNSYGESFLEIYHKDLPVFVSTDAILHAFHKSYDRILTDVEVGLLIPKLQELLSLLSGKMTNLNAAYGNDTAMTKMLRDVDLYITMPRILLGENVSPFYPETQTEINSLLNLINQENISSYPLFSTTCKDLDFSQFKPRGHYINPQLPQLAKYFKAMIWLSRMEVYLIAPNVEGILCPMQKFSDIKRQVIDAILISELIEIAGCQNKVKQIDDVLKFFVGEQDNVHYFNLKEVKNLVQITSANQLLDSIKVVQFQDTLAKQPYANQLILSQFLMQADPYSPDSIKPASAFMLFGQRFVIDSYVMGSVVWDRIQFNGERLCRLFPSTLDPIAALGNDAALQLLQSELNQWKYGSNLASLRYIIDQYQDTYWYSTLYLSWLQTIRKLNPPLVRTGLPPFMQTAAFWQEKLNTQLFSWTELRHDNLLYAKQSYTGGTICSYPYAYVEPFPEFYQSLKTLADTASVRFNNLDFNNTWLKTSVVNYFTYMSVVSDSLKNICEKELNGTPLTLNEAYWLKNIVYQTNPGSGEPPYLGWYSKLFYDDNYYNNEGLLDKDFIVADVHTIPTDCGGGWLGNVMHVGTGPHNLGVFIADIPGSGNVAFVGPVSSYYEYTTINLLRLTDQEWDQTYLNASLRPNWTNIYLADSTGNSRGEGLSLITSVKPDENIIPKGYLTAANYPNPFNPSTIIVFNIPPELSNSQVVLNIYNVQGELINTLVRENLPSGNYAVRWEGNNFNDQKVTSGVYIYNLKAGEKQFSGKMTLLK